MRLFDNLPNLGMLFKCMLLGGLIPAVYAAQFNVNFILNAPLNGSMAVSQSSPSNMSEQAVKPLIPFHLLVFISPSLVRL